jgi:hypothetical protein
MNYQEWLGSVPMEIQGDPLWKVEAYRLALFVGELGWHDVTKLIKDKRTLELSDQLYRALGSIAPISMSTPLALLARAAAGITMAATCWARPLQNIECAS